MIKKYPHNVIVEGVQILDTTMSENAKTLFKGEPIIVLQTTKALSVERGMARDKVTDVTVSTMMERANEAYKLKTDLEKELNLSIGKHYVEQLIAERRH